MPTPRRVLPIIAASLALALALAHSPAHAVTAPGATPRPSGYHLIKTIKVGGEGFWDYLNFDSSTRRLFISRGTRVDVLDVDSEKIVGTIPDTPGVHGIALAPELGDGFTCHGQAC